MSDLLNRQLEINDKNLLMLKERIVHLNKEKGMAYQYIIDEAKLTNTSVSKLSRFCTQHDKWKHTLVTSDYKLLVTWIIGNGYWNDNSFSSSISSLEHNIYHSLCSFLMIGQGTKDDIEERAPGLYRVYRHSILLPKQYVVGMSKIWKDENTQAICVIEEYGRDSEKTGEIEFRGIYESYHGYMTQKGGNYYLLTRDESVSTLNMTTLPYGRRDKDVITMMYGMTQGTMDKNSYSSKIFYERFDGEEDDLKQYIGLYKKRDMPKIVLNYLNDGIRIHTA